MIITNYKSLDGSIIYRYDVYKREKAPYKVGAFLFYVLSK